MAPTVDMTLPMIPTAGLVWNRKDRRGPGGEFLPIVGRDGNQRPGSNSVFSGGKDFTSLPDRSRLKMRIPNTSVVNKVGDCGCCGLRLTAAQWLWLLNAFCFCAHTAMCFITAYFAFWSKDLDKYDSDPNLITIYRVSSKWDNTTVQGYTFVMEDNGMPFNLATGVLVFFAISATFHLFAVVAGTCEATWLWYWRQMDDAFCYWRWAEYSLSCSLMGVLIAITLGLREQNTLVCLFALLAITQAFGFLTELYSRPVVSPDTTNYAYPVGKRGFTGAPDYDENPNALYLVSQTDWEGDRVIRDKEGNLLTKKLDFVHAQRVSNWIRRLVPYFLGWFPFLVYVFVCIYHLEYNAMKLHEERPDLKIPDFVRGILYGTFVLFTSFAFVQPLYQWFPPGFYWGSEATYCILSLSAKMYLGWLIIINVLMQEGRAEDLLGAAGLESR